MVNLLVELLYLVEILLVDVAVAKSLLEDICRVTNVLIVLIDDVFAPFVDVATIFALVIFEDILVKLVINAFADVLKRCCNIAEHVFDERV